MAQAHCRVCTKLTVIIDCVTILTNLKENHRVTVIVPRESVDWMLHLPVRDPIQLHHYEKHLLKMSRWRYVLTWYFKEDMWHRCHSKELSQRKDTMAIFNYCSTVSSWEWSNYKHWVTRPDNLKWNKQTRMDFRWGTITMKKAIIKKNKDRQQAQQNVFFLSHCINKHLICTSFLKIKDKLKV